MPSHKIHVTVDRLLFGRGYHRVHKVIDIIGHDYRGRRRWPHGDPLSAALISLLVCGDPRPGLLHLILDEVVSTCKKRSRGTSR